jgi:S1-C subfamily serine protease
MATGGLLLEDMSPEDRAKAGAVDKGMALRVKHVGQFGAHAAAKNAGFQTGDVVVGYDGRTDLTREADVLAHGVTARKPGDRVEVVVLRGGKKQTLTLPVQE